MLKRYPFTAPEVKLIKCPYIVSDHYQSDNDGYFLISHDGLISTSFLNARWSPSLMLKDIIVHVDEKLIPHFQRYLKFIQFWIGTKNILLTDVIKIIFKIGSTLPYENNLTSIAI